MKAILTRSGGFAGVTLRREVEISPAQLAQLRSESQRIPDAFAYELTINGETFNVSEEDAEGLLPGIR